MKHNGGRRPDEILAEIDRTRGEMDRTLSAIEHRLTPGQLVDHGIDYLRHSGANEFVQNLGGAAKQNPLPVALASIGIAWLMALGRQPAQQPQGSGFTSSSSGGMREKAGNAMQGISERMGSAKSQFGDTASSVRERANQMTDTARYQWERTRGGVDYLVQEQPLVLGAIGLAIGALLGGVAPRTQKEEELMGEASRQVAEKAKTMGSQQLEKAKETVTQVAEQVKSQAKPEGQAQPSAHAAINPTAAPPASPSGPRPPRRGI